MSKMHIFRFYQFQARHHRFFEESMKENDTFPELDFGIGQRLSMKAQAEHEQAHAEHEHAPAHFGILQFGAIRAR